MGHRQPSGPPPFAGELEPASAWSGPRASARPTHVGIGHPQPSGPPRLPGELELAESGPHASGRGTRMSNMPSPRPSGTGGSRQSGMSLRPSGTVGARQSTTFGAYGDGDFVKVGQQGSGARTQGFVGPRASGTNGRRSGAAGVDNFLGAWGGPQDRTPSARGGGRGQGGPGGGGSRSGLEYFMSAPELGESDRNWLASRMGRR